MAKLNVSPGAKTRLSRAMRTRSESPGARVATRRLPRSSSSLLTNSPERSAKRNFDRLRRRGIVAGRELHEQSCRRRGGDQHVDAVVGSRTPLPDDELRRAARAAVEPHRAGLVGLDAQRLRLGERSLANRDRSLPHALGAAAPGDSHPQVVGHRRSATPAPEAGRSRQHAATQPRCGSRQARAGWQPTPPVAGKRHLRDALGHPCPIIGTPCHKRQ